MSKWGEGFFRAFFSIAPKTIRKTVVISPIVYPNLVEKALSQESKQFKSILGYLVAQFKSFTFIKTPMSQAAVADLMLLLGQTKCEQVIFIGAIGALAPNFEIGDTFLTDDQADIYSFASIHDETDMKLRELKKNGVVGIDFESKIFFKQAKKLRLSAKAFYVVTDLPLIKPFYKQKNKIDKERIKKSLSLGVFEVIRSSEIPLRRQDAKKK